MYCEQCGEKIIDGMRFCTQCGASTPNPEVTKTQASLPQEDMPQANVPQPVTPSQQQVRSAMPVMQPQGKVSQPERKPSKSPDEPSKTQSSGPAFIALAIATIALVVAIVGGFVLPSINQSNSGPKAVQAGTTTITIKAGEQTGKAKILEEDTPCIVIATSAGGDATFSDVMFNTTSGELVIAAEKKMDKDVERGVYWVAYEK